MADALTNVFLNFYTIQGHLHPPGMHTTITTTIISYFLRLNTSRDTLQIDFCERRLAAEATTLPFSGGKGPERAETALRKLGHRSLRMYGYFFTTHLPSNSRFDTFKTHTLNPHYRRSSDFIRIITLYHILNGILWSTSYPQAQRRDTSSPLSVNA